LPDFARRLVELARDGATAADGDGWSQQRVSDYVRTMELVPLAVSAGADGSLDRFARERVPAPDDQGNCPPPTPAPRPPDRSTICTESCLVRWEECRKENAGRDDGLVACAFEHMACLIRRPEPNVCQEGSACLQMVLYACTGDCLWPH
jgi:hypothetical protein